jgi:hypothetical protein
MISAPVVHARYPWRHDPAKLAGTLIQLLAEHAEGGKG